MNERSPTVDRPDAAPRSRMLPLRAYAWPVLLAAALWGVNLVWLSRESRPPVWDMAMHQSYALNYLPGRAERTAGSFWERSGNYPPFVHWMIAGVYAVAHPGPRIAALANLPATFLLLVSVYALACDLAGARAARWAAFITATIPFLVWMSRETILDYWLSAWVAASLALLVRTDGFAKRGISLLFGVVAGLGMLTKWLLPAFLAAPLGYVYLRGRVWRDRERHVHFLDAIIAAGLVAAPWYLSNLGRFGAYFVENARIGAEEGEPPVLSLQSLVYYVRLLEGYQLFALLFAVTAVACVMVWRRRLLADGGFLAAALVGGWLAMTLLRTKDPRFTMPLLGPLAIVSGAWIASWGTSVAAGASRAAIVALLAVQVYVSNFGARWVPQEVVLARGYQGSLRWDWNLYLQHYFHILGRPRREDWRQVEILSRVASDATAGTSIAVVPDLPRFSAANLQLTARLLGIRARVDHPRPSEVGLRSFDRFDYVVTAGGDQGMPWSTRASTALNAVVEGASDVFELLGSYPLPNGQTARLYAIRRAGPTKPSGSEAPTKPSGSEAPTKPSGSEAPTKPSGSEAPTKPSGTEAPTKRSGSEAPTKRSGSEAPTKRSGS